MFKMASYQILVVIVTLASVLESSLSSVDITSMRLKKILNTSYSRERAPSSTQVDQPLVVLLSVHVRELLLNEDEMTMSVHGFDVVQSWTDPRLAAVTHDARDLHLYNEAVDEIWTPDIHIINARQQKPADYRALTVSKSGLVTLHQRLSVDLLCPNFTSHLKPLVCSVQLQPYSNVDSEVIYEWGTVTLEPQLTVPKYSLVRLTTGSCIMVTSVGSYSCKQLSMAFRGDVNFFATEVYGATFLLVALSWTGFWIDTPDSGIGQRGRSAVRLGLGLVIVLILVVYGVGFRLLHNKVGVPGNVEVWVAFCTLFVLASLIEYVFVHILLCAVPQQLKRVCCKKTANIVAPSCRNEVNSIESSDENTNFKKAVRVIDVTCGLLFPVIFVFFNIAYWATY